jgi:hypothetical protein
MKKLMLAAVSAAVLAGCVAVPVYDSGPGAYYAPPAVGVYVAPPVVQYRYSTRSYYRDHDRDGRRYRR